VAPERVEEEFALSSRREILGVALPVFAIRLARVRPQALDRDKMEPTASLGVRTA